MGRHIGQCTALPVYHVAKVTNLSEAGANYLLSSVSFALMLGVLGYLIYMNEADRYGLSTPAHLTYSGSRIRNTGTSCFCLSDLR